MRTERKRVISMNIVASLRIKEVGHHRGKAFCLLLAFLDIL